MLLISHHLTLITSVEKQPPDINTALIIKGCARSLKRNFQIQGDSINTRLRLMTTLKSRHRNKKARYNKIQIKKYLYNLIL